MSSAGARRDDGEQELPQHAVHLGIGRETQVTARHLDVSRSGFPRDAGGVRCAVCVRAGLGIVSLTAPANAAPWIDLAWLVLGAALYAYLSARSPAALKETATIFVEA